MKKVLQCLLASIIIVMLVATRVFAKSDNIENIKLIDSVQVNEQVLFNQYTMDTSFDKEAFKIKRDVFTYTINQNEMTKLATWTYSSKDDYSLHTLMEIAKDYERKHPGWIVLGGVNAEGYYKNELTNAFIQDGDVIRKDVSKEAFKELIGFKKDGSHVIKQQPIASDYPRLKINDSSYEVKYINEIPQDLEIALLTPDLTNNLDLTNYFVWEGTYDLYRKSENFPSGTFSGPNLGIFVKGKFEKEVSLTTLSEVKPSKFYLVSKNQEVIRAIKESIGSVIKCQYDYIDEYSDVTSMVGYMYKLVIDNQTIPLDYIDTTDNNQKVVYDCSYYKTTSKERCGIGFKDNGEIVLLTTNTGNGGPTQYEVGEMFREFGCTNAYQFDGGGSVTFIKRDELGDFEMLNIPGDGSARKIMSGLFIVTRDPAYSQSFPETTASSITLTKKSTSYIDEIKNYQVEINGNKFSPIDGKIKIDGLNDDTTYFLKISYEYKGELVQTNLKVNTKKFTPKLDVISLHNGFRFIDYTKDETLNIDKLVIYIEDEPYIFDGTNSFEVTSLDKGRDYTIYYEYTYTNTLTNQTFTKNSESKVYTTKSYQDPSIETFEIYSKNDSRIVLKYKYTDIDKLVKSSYFVINNEIVILDLSSGIKRIENLDLTKYDYHIVMKLEYVTPEGKAKFLTSEVIEVKAQKPEEHVHHYLSATCETPSKCEECGEEQGEALGHDWIMATTDNPKTCRRCGKTEGDALPKDNPEPVLNVPKPQKGCSCKKENQVFLTFISVSGLILFLLRKKK